MKKVATMKGVTAVLALVLSAAVNLSEGFTLIPASGRRAVVFSSQSKERHLSATTTASSDSKQEQDKETDKSTSYDPSDVFNNEKSTLEQSLIELLKIQGPEKKDVEAQCFDIVRDLDGRPLTVEYFAEKLNLPSLEAYTCPETDAFRGLMSDACRVHLHPGGVTCYYKRIILKDLEHAQKKLKSAPYKLKSDAKSYQVVISFLTSKACQLVREKAGVGIPNCYDGQLVVNEDNPIESKFCFLLEDFSPAQGWYQRWLLEEEDECKATLKMYARIHAFFWSGSSFWRNEAKAARELEAGVWESASYVQPKRNLNQCNNVAKSWATERLKFEPQLSSMDYWDNLGERLQSIAEESGRLAHPFAEDTPLSESFQKFRTFCHGDPKQANLLFRRSLTEESSSSSSTSSESKLQVGMLDFQWCGFGLAATDIAHHLTSAVDAAALKDGGEEMLLRYYFGELQKHLVEFGAYPNAEDALRNFSYNTFLEQYETGVLDICRLVIAYAWSRYGPVDKNDKEGCERTMNKTSYNKSIPNVVWLMSRCDEIMKSRGI